MLLRSAGRTIERQVDLQVSSAHGLAVSAGLVACACAGGVVRLFSCRSLAFRANLPRPAARGHLLAAASPAAAAPFGVDQRFPDALSCSFDSLGSQLTVLYRWGLPRGVE